EIWEENKRLRATTEMGPVLMAVDYFIETRGGKTVLRLVHSGFGPEADWDEEFDATERGWSWFLLQLRHYLARHAGTPRRAIWARSRSTLGGAEVWRRVLGPDGLNIGEPPPPGSPYSFTTAGGDTFRGQVLLLDAPHVWGVTVENLDDATMLVE